MCTSQLPVGPRTAGSARMRRVSSARDVPFWRRAVTAFSCGSAWAAPGSGSSWVSRSCRTRNELGFMSAKHRSSRARCWLQCRLLSAVRCRKSLRQQPVQLRCPRHQADQRMPEIRMTVIDESGLHARPAARFVQAASRFSSRIVIRNGEREADAKSLISLLGLAVRLSSVITVAAEGTDAEAALASLTDELSPYVTPINGTVSQ